eukprot:2202577-Karenia_brevis.AAC.1
MAKPSHSGICLQSHVERTSLICEENFLLTGMSTHLRIFRCRLEALAIVDKIECIIRKASNDTSVPPISSAHMRINP